MITQNECSEESVILEYTCYTMFSRSWTMIAKAQGHLLLPDKDPVLKTL